MRPHPAEAPISSGQRVWRLVLAVARNAVGVVGLARATR